MSSIIIPSELAKGHDFGKVGGAEKIGRKWVQTFVDLGGLTAGASILDIGCGPGRMAVAIGDRFDWKNDYVGFEIRWKDVKFCRNNIQTAHPNFRFLHANLKSPHYNPDGAEDPLTLRFPADDASIDFCFATSVFTHMFRAEVAHYIAEAARVLRPGGVLFSTWFVLDDYSRAGIAAGASRFNFTKPHRGAWIEDAERPEDAVAHDLPSVEAMHADVGLRPGEFHQGNWMGEARPRTRPARHSQDVYVSSKPV